MGSLRRVLGRAALALALFGAAVGAALAIDVFSDETLTLNGEFDDMVFAAGGDIGLGVRVTDDVFAAGGDISVDGVAADHAIVAGGDISFADLAVKDVIVAGGSIAMASGAVADDVVAAGGSINIYAAFEVGVLAGGDLDIAGSIGGDLRASAGEIRLDGAVGGNADLSAASISIGPGAVIAGDLTHRAREIDIDPEARIDGEIIALDPRERRGPSGEDPVAQVTAVAAAAAAAPLAIAALIYWIGLTVRRRFAKRDDAPNLAGRFLWSLAGVAIFVFLTLIPLVGGLVWIVGFVFGFGAIAAQGARALAEA